MQSIINSEFSEHLKVSEDTLKAIAHKIEIAAKICIDCLKNNNKILLMGNGGSAADAQHIAAELVGRYKTERNGLAAIALTTDTSAITAIANDYGYKNIFSRQVEALAIKNDVLIAISTGGTSKNVINALKVSKDIGCKSIGFSGKDGGKFSDLCDVNLVVNSNNTPRIQEMHILIGHLICHLIEMEITTPKNVE